MTETEVRPLLPLVDILALMAESAASSWELFELDLPDVVDPLQEFAERTGLLAAVGQDAVQKIISEPFGWVTEVAARLPPDNYAAELVRKWEMDDDRWRHTGEPPPELGVAFFTPEPRAYRTPEATADAFWFVVSLEDPPRLKAWLADHPRDTPYLLKLLEGK